MEKTPPTLSSRLVDARIFFLTQYIPPFKYRNRSKFTISLEQNFGSLRQQFANVSQQRALFNGQAMAA